MPAAGADRLSGGQGLAFDNDMTRTRGVDTAEITPAGAERCVFDDALAVASGSAH